MNIENKKEIIMTLDAGGTNFVFSAVQSGKFLTEQFVLPSNAHDLELCLQTIISGFRKVWNSLGEKPLAISFAFPGPADYPRGVIGELGNLPAFAEGGVALGPMLEKEFGVPVFINNDGDLYAYGEAIAGFLPEVNSMLERAGSRKRYKNLLAVTLGTGFGAGIVHEGNLLLGDNSAAGEIFLLRSKENPSMNVEEFVSIRGVQRFFAEEANIELGETTPTPKEIFEIGIGRRKGNSQAARKAYERFGEALGDALANIITVVDGLIVIGGGIAAAHSLFLESMIEEMNSFYSLPDGSQVKRLVSKVYNLEDELQKSEFLKDKSRSTKIPFSEEMISYETEKRLGVGISRIGTSKAIMLGAYAFAVKKLEEDRGVIR
jgi:glucokinase